MNYSIIDKKKESHNFGIWPFNEKVTTTLTLVKTDEGKFGVLYECDFSGMKKGHVSGGPFIVTKDESICVHEDPKVMVYISNFHKTESSITMTIKITVNIPIINTVTIFEKTLSGIYSSKQAWNEIAENINIKMAEAKDKALV